MLDGGPRTADAVTSEASDLLYVPRTKFTDLLENEPALAIRVIGFLCARLRWMSGRMEETNMSPLPARLAARLLGICEDYGNEIEITQDELAQFVGASREHVNRQLQIWRRAGVIDLGRGTIRVCDRGLLAGMVSQASP